MGFAALNPSYNLGRQLKTKQTLHQVIHDLTLARE
jgi:hypothetical protein